MDRIPKINSHDHARVDATKDSTEDAGGGAQPEEEEEQSRPKSPGDGFNPLMDKTNWQIYLDPTRTNQKMLTLQTADISEMRFLKINLKTNPSLLNVAVTLKDGMTYPSAYVSLARHLAVSFQHEKENGRLDVRDVTEDKTLTLFVPDVRTQEEVTRVTRVPERTLSQTVKMLVKKTWIQKLGLQDPDTRRTNGEIVLAYVTVIVVLLALIFAFVWLMK